MAQSTWRGDCATVIKPFLVHFMDSFPPFRIVPGGTCSDVANSFQPVPDTIRVPSEISILGTGYRLVPIQV